MVLEARECAFPGLLLLPQTRSCCNWPLRRLRSWLTSPSWELRAHLQACSKLNFGAGAPKFYPVDSMSAWHADMQWAGPAASKGQRWKLLTEYVVRRLSHHGDVLLG